MPYWTTQRWIAEQPTLNVVTDEAGVPLPPAELKLQHGACEFCLGPEYIIGEAEPKISKLAQLEMVTIRPGEIAMLMTEEVLRVPKNAIALISIRKKYKFQGLINVSGFHADPGFWGRIKYCVYNAGGQVIQIQRGSQVFSVWLSQLPEDESNPYNGDSNGQLHFEEEDARLMKAEPLSPKALVKRIDMLESDVKDLRTRVNFVDQWWFRMLATVIIFCVGYFIHYLK